MAETITDAELTQLALEGDPDEALPPDAVPLDFAAGERSNHPLPEWYMPVPMGTPRALHGWRRGMAAVIVASFVLINAYGLCSTYGVVAFG